MGQAHWMPTSHQSNTLMKKANVFLGEIGQDFSRRDKGVLIPGEI